MGGVEGAPLPPGRWWRTPSSRDEWHDQNIWMISRASSRQKKPHIAPTETHTRMSASRFRRELTSSDFKDIARHPQDHINV